jgi:biopolymer transport protein ExbD
MAYKPKAPPVMAAPNVIPMADIMLVLLIIFMVVTPMLQKGVSVDMAKVNNAEDMQDADKDDAIILAVTRDGKMYLGSKLIGLDQITTSVKDLLANRSDKTVFVRSDARAKYGEVVKAVDEVRAAGVDNLGLLTEKNPKKTQPGQAAAPGGAAPPPPGGSD